MSCELPAGGRAAAMVVRHLWGGVEGRGGTGQEWQGQAWMLEAAGGAPPGNTGRGLSVATLM